MPRCRSWRPSPVSDAEEHRNHLPSECWQCWRPCPNKVEEGVVRCRECEQLLVEHPSERVRTELVKDEAASLRVLNHMTSDSSAGVALAARARLQQMTSIGEDSDGIPDPDIIALPAGDGWGDDGWETVSDEDVPDNPLDTGRNNTATAVGVVPDTATSDPADAGW